MRKRMYRQASWLGILLVTGCVLCFSGTAAACPEADGDDSHPRLEQMFAKLDLSEEQKAKVETIFKERRSSGLELRKEEMRLRNEVRGVMLEDEPDGGKVAKLVKRIGEIRAELRIKRLEGEIAIREILTDEQRDRFLLHRERMGRNHERGDRGHRCGEHKPRSRAGCHSGSQDGPHGCAPGCGQAKGPGDHRCLHGAESGDSK